MAKGLNIELRKKNSRNRVLNIIRNNTNTSRYEIKKISKYSMSTVLAVINDLIEKNLIVEAGVGESTGGRKPTWLEINPEGAFFLGLEFNSEFIHAIALNLSGEIIYSKKEKIGAIPHDANKTVQLVIQCIKEMLQKLNKPKEKIFGIGLGVPGYVDNEEGVSLYYSQIEDWRNIEIKKVIEQEFGIRTYIENNINVMALAYQWLRPDLYGEDFIIISIRTGIRMSCVLNNRLYKGKNNTAGEIGHLRVMSSNRICSCGKKGCLDAEASNLGILFKLREGFQRNRYRELFETINKNPEEVSIQSFIDSVVKGHADSVELFMEVCDYLSDAISQVVNILNPSKIFISGPITYVGNDLLKSIKDALEKKAIFVNLKDLEVLYTSFGDEIGAVGAAALVMHKEFEFTSRHF